MQLILLYVTLKNKQEALVMAERLIAEKLAACANILPTHTAVYKWNGTPQQEEEVILLAKTTPARREQAIARIAALHNYDCPCILALPVEAAYTPFGEWVFSQIGD